MTTDVVRNQLVVLFSRSVQPHSFLLLHNFQSRNEKCKHFRIYGAHKFASHERFLYVRLRKHTHTYKHTHTEKEREKEPQYKSITKHMSDILNCFKVLMQCAMDADGIRSGYVLCLEKSSVIMHKQTRAGASRLVVIRF